MSSNHTEAYRDGELARRLADRIRAVSVRPLRLMEVCGTHTVAIFRSGIRSVLPPGITLLSGPGCPVCVTAQGEIDAFVALSRRENVIVTTFGDLMRVPGSASSLQKEKATGRDIRMVYSTLDAVQIARRAPVQTGGVSRCRFRNHGAHRGGRRSGRLQDGHRQFFGAQRPQARPAGACGASGPTGPPSSTGSSCPATCPWSSARMRTGRFSRQCRIPSVVAGFEPEDILQAILILAEQVRDGAPGLENAYRRAVTAQGNPKARDIMGTVFETTDANWRGIGRIAGSGLGVRPAFAAHDARRVFDLEVRDVAEPKGCACGAILTGTRTPPECPLFRTVCTPTEPVGPCMVSSEGTCAAYYRYHDGR